MSTIELFIWFPILNILFKSGEEYENQLGGNDDIAPYHAEPMTKVYDQWGDQTPQTALYVLIVVSFYFPRFMSSRFEQARYAFAAASTISVLAALALIISM